MPSLTDEPIDNHSHSPSETEDVTHDVVPDDDPHLGTALLSERTQVVLHLIHADVQIQLPARMHLILGRFTPEAPPAVDIDLSAYAARERGVSRQHAAILRQKNVLFLVDLGSSNGTFLNRERLVPDQKRVLRHGDEVFLGMLGFHIRFQGFEER